MSVTIRLARIGRKNLPAFRLVVANTKSKRNGRFLDTIGSYNPLDKPILLSFDKEKLALWKSRGALITESVTKLLEGTYDFKPYPSAKKLKAEQKKVQQAGQA